MNSENVNLKQADTILVTFLMQLGDLVLTTPFLAALRKAAPKAKITYLIDEKWLPIVSENPDIDEVLTIDRKGKDKGFFALNKYASSLRKRKFDFLINLNPSERCSFLAAFSGAKYKTGSTHRIFRPFFDKVVQLERKIHAADMYLDVLAKLGVEDLTNEGLKVVTSRNDEQEAAEFFSLHDIKTKNNLIGFNIGSASATKRWLPERFAQVADYLADKGYKIVFFGSSNELEMVKETISYMQNKPLIATGKLSIGGLVAAINYVNLLLTNDSGPMHLAISQKVPIVALYGPSKPELYGPYKAQKSIVVRANPMCLDCREHMKHVCSDMRCMNNISVQDVIKATEQMLLEINDN